MNTSRYLLAALVIIGGSVALHAGVEQTGEKKLETRVFELRTYYANPGKMEALHARFRDHTNKLLEKHGMQLIGFWTDSKEPQRKLIYLVGHKNKATADASWKAFGADPDWKVARDNSEKGGKLVEKVDVTWLNPTDYSAMK